MNYAQEIESIDEKFRNAQELDECEDCHEKLITLTKKMQQELITLNKVEDDNAALRGKTDALSFVNRWIPCSERLPEKSDYYWVTIENRKCEHLTMKWFYQLDLGFSQIEGKVIAWMSLPEPFKGHLC